MESLVRFFFSLYFFFFLFYIPQFTVISYNKQNFTIILPDISGYLLYYCTYRYATLNIFIFFFFSFFWSFLISHQTWRDLGRKEKIPITIGEVEKFRSLKTVVCLGSVRVNWKSLDLCASLHAERNEKRRSAARVEC
ncbi:hypothetical protein PUN28_019931 [Cardiocondyla obscurior]|uniref:Uncharacterized protein n=1 Tax=Cardiocondyla obscurior TaxID=286306 RepID=A0AAW2E862_9HYME